MSLTELLIAIIHNLPIHVPVLLAPGRKKEKSDTIFCVYLLLGSDILKVDTNTMGIMNAEKNMIIDTIIMVLKHQIMPKLLHLCYFNALLCTFLFSLGYKSTPMVSTLPPQFVLCFGSDCWTYHRFDLYNLILESTVVRNASFPKQSFPESLPNETSWCRMKLY